MVDSNLGMNHEHKNTHLLMNQSINFVKLQLPQLNTIVFIHCMRSPRFSVLNFVRNALS